MTPATDYSGKLVCIFLLLTFGLSSIFYILIIHAGSISGGFGLYVAGLMWCPGIAALLSCKICGVPVRSMGWQWGKNNYQVWAYLIPVLYTIAAYSTIWAFGWGSFYNKEFEKNITHSFGWPSLPPGISLFGYFLLIGVFGMAGGMATALGEETGWRGLLVPQLYKRLGFTRTSLLTGIIWAVWHYPILLFADYNSGTPAWYALTCFTVLVVSISFIYTWFRIKSGSLWTGVILHASHNLYIQSIFTPLTIDTGKTKYFIDEFGIVLPAICLLLAIWFYSKRKQLLHPATQ
ncbi:MAG: type II CAAX endopeptidase family protein [Niabella sp.]